MWDFLKNAGNGFSDFLKNNADSINAVGAVVGGVGSAIASHKQAKLQQKQFNFNLDLAREERKRRNRSEQDLQRAWSGSNLNIYRKRNEDEEM
ncbi:hypothetical protein CPIN18021_0244 [Campylobacter pinnipediorum subsp. caledonicus]|uniref:Uncharacterized protein n=1 Tax=Campylobacter pinnipediorum subsp. caledonicus TaxID=1874362 RepID=A0A1S6U5T2_9BACT|nr:hypothetical protein [Campylobacter pinnipediorum]AQW87091.1 hypothetical protein CPIN18021_0244 [Campylobacter pinnipediorum subsp. caledonicus]